MWLLKAAACFPSGDLELTVSIEPLPRRSQLGEWREKQPAAPPPPRGHTLTQK